MPEKSATLAPANLADAILRLWLLAEIAMAAMYGWAAWRLWPYAGDWAAPPPMRAVAVVEGLYLFLFVPAAITTAALWHQTRDRRLAAAVLGYGLASAASFALWPMAATLGAVRALYVADAAVSLIGMAAARRAIRLRRFRA